MSIQKSLFYTLCLWMVSLTMTSQTFMQNATNRTSTTLNGKWHYIVDMYETGYYDYRLMPFDTHDDPGKNAFFTNSKAENKTDLIEYNFDDSPTLMVPGDWNSQDEKLFYYEGTIWYKRSFDYQKKKENNRLYVRFEAVNYQSEVYLNGKKLGSHEGGFTPFEFDITDIVKPTDNFLIVKVDNKRKRDGVPTVNTDWYNYGGITRDVSLIETSASFIKDYKLQLKKNDLHTLNGFIQLSGNDIADKTVEVNIPELKINKSYTTDAEGRVEYEIPVKKMEYWDVENPKLYAVNLSFGDDKITDQIGFRTIKVEGTDILLNGESVFLRGICIHEENPVSGSRAYSMEDAKMLLGWAKELGCNFVRLAHYPHNENMVRLADEMGILVWEENPVYWTVLFGNEPTYQKAETQLKEVISRDKNRASVIIWSMANETPRGDERLQFLKRLADTARKIDETRLISAALEKHNVKGKHNVLTVDDQFADYVDIISFNEYVGWYDGLPEKCTRVKWEIKQNKPVFISEFGAGALQGFHGDKDTRWSEEYQQYLYETTTKMLDEIPQLRGMSPWILADFRSPRRLLPNIQDGWNRKGLISETGNKKKAFYILQNFYKQKKEQWSKK